MLCELYHRLIDGGYAILLGDEDVAWRRGPLQAEQVILLSLCMSIISSLSSYPRNISFHLDISDIFAVTVPRYLESQSIAPCG